MLAIWKSTDNTERSTVEICSLCQGKQILAPAGWAWEWQNTSGGLLPEQIERGADCIALHRIASPSLSKSHVLLHTSMISLGDFLDVTHTFKVCFVEQRLFIIVSLRRIRISSLWELVECLGNSFFFMISSFPVHVSFVKPRISTIPTSNAWDIWGNKLRRNSWQVRRMDPLRARWNGFVAFSRRLSHESIWIHVNLLSVVIIGFSGFV